MQAKRFQNDVKTYKQGGYYHSGEGAFFTSPLLQTLVRSSYGTLINESSRTGQYQIRREQQKGALNYLRSYRDDSKKLQVLKGQLRSVLDEGKQQVKKATLQQISWIFPWVFSNSMLFQPLRTVIYCLDQGLDPNTATIVIKTVSALQINKVVNNAILKCVKYNAPTLQIAIFSLDEQIFGYQTQTWGTWFKQLIEKVKNATVNSGPVAKFMGGLSYLGSFFKQILSDQPQVIKDKSFDFENLVTFVGDENKIKSMMGMLMHKVTKDLKSYGEIVLNFDLIKQVARTKFIQSQIFYYFPDRPDILFNVSNSFPRVYRYMGENLQLIPQSMFTIDYLRGMLTSQLIKFTGRIMNSVDEQYNDPQPIKKSKTEFRQKYLTFEDPLRTRNQILIQNAITAGLDKDPKVAAQRLDVMADIRQRLQTGEVSLANLQAAEKISTDKQVNKIKDYTDTYALRSKILNNLLNVPTESLKQIDKALSGTQWKPKPYQQFQNKTKLTNLFKS